MSTKKKAARMTHPGDMVMIPVLAIEFREGGNTLWIHGQGGTVLRLKTLDGAITSKRCQSSPISHGDAIIQGDLEICVADKSEASAAFERDYLVSTLEISPSGNVDDSGTGPQRDSGGHTLYCPRGCCDTPPGRDFGNGGRWEGPK